MYTHVHECIHIHIHKYVYAYIYTHIYTYINFARNDVVLQLFVMLNYLKHTLESCNRKKQRVLRLDAFMF